MGYLFFVFANRAICISKCNLRSAGADKNERCSPSGRNASRAWLMLFGRNGGVYAEWFSGIIWEVNPRSMRRR